jgi:uncharacterized protein
VNFWDSSAIIPLCLDEPMSGWARAVHEGDPDMAAWWATPVECRSSFARLERDSVPAAVGVRGAVESLEDLSQAWLEILPSDRVRDTAMRLLAVHPLRVADSLQLAAALIWSGHSPRGRGFACLDRRLRKAAFLEGFSVQPADMPGEE